MSLDPDAWLTGSGGAPDAPALGASAVGDGPAVGDGTAVGDGPAVGDAAGGPVAAAVRALLARLDGAPIGDHAEVFGDIHGVLQNALTDAGRDSAPN